MTDFTSSDGRIRIAYENDLAERIDIFSARGGENMLDGAPWLGRDEVSALREFFQHERDDELGRWRYPLDPDYVVYPNPDEVFEQMFGPGLDLVVLRESDAMTKGYVRAEDQGLEPAAHRAGHIFAARAYFEAHPEPKTWHDAKPGEVWLLDLEGTEYAAVREYGADFKLSNTNLLSPRDERISTGRRIWPEDAS